MRIIQSNASKTTLELTPQETEFIVQSLCDTVNRAAIFKAVRHLNHIGEEPTGTHAMSVAALLSSNVEYWTQSSKTNGRLSSN